MEQNLLSIQTPLFDGDIMLEDLVLLIQPVSKATPKVIFSIIQTLVSSSEHTVVVDDGLVRKWFSNPGDADIRDKIGWVFRPVPEVITRNEWDMPLDKTVILYPPHSSETVEVCAVCSAYTSKITCL